MDIAEYLYELKGQEVMRVIAAIGPVEQLPLICPLCRTPYNDDECPTCKTEREDARRLIEERLQRDREEKQKLLDDLEEWLKQLGDEV